MKHSLCLILLGVILTPSNQFLHGKPEEGDNTRRSDTALDMLNQLYSAAKARADKIRIQEGREKSMSPVDMLAMAVDYAKDKVEKPPMLTVEKNLIMLNRNIRRLARELKRVSSGVSDTQKCRDCDAVIEDSVLHPVQGERYTIIHNRNTRGG